MAQSAKCSAKAENLLTSMIILVIYIYILFYFILFYFIGDERARTCTNVHERAQTYANDYKRLRTARLHLQTKMQTKTNSQK